MDKKFILATIVMFVVTMLLGFLTHGWALADEYEATGLFRPMAEQEAYFMWMLLGHLVLSVAIVHIYRRGREEKPWLGQGIRFGFSIALLAVVPIYLIYYSVQPLPEMLVFRQISYDTVNMMIAGAVVAWMYR